jgi:hypothetical protein
MRLITDSKTLEREFLRLQESYEKYYWLTAWASASSVSFEKLKLSRERIEKIVVGIHFYQTHPDFIETFLDTETIRYIKQPEGTFHPKLFLFFNSNNDWEALIGSANYTRAAFTINTEISTLISFRDKNADKTLSNIFEIINSVWVESKQFDKKELDNYRKIWKNYRPKINSLSGDYGNANNDQKKSNKPMHLVPVANMDWDEYVVKVKNEQYNSLNSRLKLLQIAKSLFGKVESFKDLSEDERKFIAGMPNNLAVDKDVDWGYFGSMKGAGKFKNRIKENDKNISNALDEIPLSGQIIKLHYQRFLDKYKKTFDGNYLGTASRLLAMKRPDVFVCLDSKNKSQLCKNFGIVQKDLGYDRYWDDIILRIYDSVWWSNPRPNDKIEKDISNSRAAFLDSLYYEE